MQKKRLKKKNPVVYVLALIIFISIGYAALSSNLKINGKAKVNATAWDVHFDNIVVTEGSVDANLLGLKAATIDPNDNTKVDYVVSLLKPGEFYEFTVDVVNDGTLDAMLDTYVTTNLTESQKKYLKYTVEYLDGGKIARDGKNDLLEKGKTETIKVGLYYNNDIKESDLPTDIESLSVTVEMNYVQANSTATKREIVEKRMVTNSDIGRYVDLGVDVVRTDSTTDDWRVLYVDDTKNEVYCVLADVLPSSYYDDELPSYLRHDGRSLMLYRSDAVNDWASYLLADYNSKFEISDAKKVYRTMPSELF